MKTKQKKELHLKSVKELEVLLKDAKDLLFAAMFDKAQNKLKNTRQSFMKRKEIAQMLTILREKELAAKTGAKI